MKKYISPNTETIETVYGFAICDPSAGKGGFQNPDPEGDTNSAPKRVVF